ncbi:MAG: 6-carboxytetrahydropterin synthase [Sedimenticola sp.]
MTTLFVNRLTVMDLSYLDPERGLLGESWMVDVELDGSLDHQGMVLDFAKVKKQVKQTIDLHFDHKLLVPAAYEGCQVSVQEHRSEVLFRLTTGAEIRHSAPLSAVTTLDVERIDESSLSKAIIDTLRPQLPDNVMGIRIRLHTESIEGAHYQYSHGLKHHEGNCQRIAHGHRSRIVIERNGVRDPELEKQWADRWHDAYIATRGDLLESFDKDGTAFHRFGYTANQGLFELELPSASCHIIDSDSTVENIAQYLADRLKQEHPEDNFRVYAFEGVDKGAVGVA